MGVRKLKPITPGQRFRVVNDFKALTPGVEPEKSLLVSKKSRGGRNNTGKMTVRYQGGGHKQQYRLIDFKREKLNIPATVKSVEYDPNRSAFIALMVYADGEKRYILAPNGVTVGMKLVSGPGNAPEVGNALPLSDLPLGTVVHNIEMRPGQGGVIARSAGAFAQLVARDGGYAVSRARILQLGGHCAASLCRLLGRQDHVSAVCPGALTYSDHAGTRCRCTPAGFHRAGSSKGRQCHPSYV